MIGFLKRRRDRRAQQVQDLVAVMALIIACDMDFGISFGRSVVRLRERYGAKPGFEKAIAELSESAWVKSRLAATKSPIDVVMYTAEGAKPLINPGLRLRR